MSKKDNEWNGCLPVSIFIFLLVAAGFLAEFLFKGKRKLREYNNEEPITDIGLLQILFVLVIIAAIIHYTRGNKSKDRDKE